MDSEASSGYYVHMNERETARAILFAKLRSTQKLVLFTINAGAFAIAGSDRWQVNLETLAKGAGLTRATVAKTAIDLEAVRWLEIVRGDKTVGRRVSNTYRVTPPGG